MVYYNKDSSSDLKPILIVVSAITAIIFGAGYFAYASSNHGQSESTSSSESTVSSHSHV